MCSFGGPAARSVAMSLIVAANGKSEVVMAADTYGYVGDQMGYYGFRCQKIRIIRNSWALGITDSQIGFDLYSQLKEENIELDDDVTIGVHQYAKRTHELYQALSYKGDAAFMLCAVGKGGPLIYRWRFPEFQGAQLANDWAAIGVAAHGALHFLAAYYLPTMDTAQLIRLVYFSTREAAKQDLRLKTPVEVVVVRRDFVKCYGRKQLVAFEEESDEIAALLRNRFNETGPPIEGL